MLITWLILTIAFLVAAAVVPGFQVKGIGSAIVVAAIFGVMNFFIGWLIFVLFGIASLGIGFLLAFITRLLTNAVLLKITDAMTSRLTIRGFGSALMGAVVISVIGAIGDWIFRPGVHYRRW